MFRRILVFVIVAVVLGLLIGRERASAPDASRSQSAGPVVVLVHGLGSSAADWREVARDLERDHRVVLVDLPGHGVTRMPEPFGLAQAAAVLDRAIGDRTDGPVILVGHSVGGLVAAAEAVVHPTRVRALVLVETALRPQFSPDDANGLLRDFEHDYAGTLRNVWSGFGRDSAQGERLAAEAAAVDSSVLKPWIRLALSSDLSRDVAMLRQPVLAVLAPHTWEPGESWVAVAESLGYGRMPRARGVRLGRCGHYVMLDQPNDLAGEIRQFVRGVEAQPVATR